MVDRPPKQQSQQQRAALESWLVEVNAQWDALTQQLHEDKVYLTSVRARLQNLQRMQARGDALPLEARILTARIAALEAEVTCIQASLERCYLQRAWLEQQFDATRLRLARLTADNMP